MNKKYAGLTTKAHQAVVSKIGKELITAGETAMVELTGGDKDIYETFLVKVYQCGQATYRLPEGKVMGQWKDKAFSFAKFEKGKEPVRLNATKDGVEPIIEGPDIN